MKALRVFLCLAHALIARDAATGVIPRGSISVPPALSRRVLSRAEPWRCIIACRTVSTADASSPQQAAHPTRQALRAPAVEQCACGRSRTEHQRILADVVG